jgi:hypothetical protein
LTGHDRQKSPNSEGGLYVGQPRHAAGFVIRYSIIHFPNDREMQINEVARVEMINSTELSE